MARPLNLEFKDKKNEVPKRCVLLFSWERKALKDKATSCNSTITEIIHKLMNDFMYKVETQGATTVMYQYVGADLTQKDEKKKLQTQIFRCENEKFFKFTRYCLSIGDNPATFLRKLVREYLHEPIAEFSPEKLDKEIKSKKINKNSDNF